MSTPLTVCLVVLGRHVPQLAFLDILFGDEPALSSAETLYQRLLGGDPDEATERAEEYLRENSLVDYYDEIGIPALAWRKRIASAARSTRSGLRASSRAPCS